MAGCFVFTAGCRIWPALDDLDGIAFVVFEFGLKRKLGREIQVQGEFVLEDDGDAVGLGGSEELDLLNCPK